MQTHTSKQTALNQMPAVAKRIAPLIDQNTVLLDYGSGYSTKFKSFVESMGGTYYGYDPHWHDFDTNAKALSCEPTIIVCANVLNVIMEDSVIETIACLLSKYGAPVYVQIYEGNRSGVGAQTSRGYQRNQKASEYQPLLERYFAKVTRVGNVFHCQ